MSKVYLVNFSGDDIVAVFSTQKKAEDFMNYFPDERFGSPLKFDLDPELTDEVKQGLSIWTVLMLKDGTIILIRKEKMDLYKVTNLVFNIYHGIDGDRDKEYLRAQVWAKTEEQAIQITDAKRLEMIKSGEFK